MKTVEETRDFLKSEIKAIRYYLDASVARRDWAEAATTKETLDTYRFLLDWLEGKCD